MSQTPPDDPHTRGTPEEDEPSWTLRPPAGEDYPYGPQAPGHPQAPGEPHPTSKPHADGDPSGTGGYPPAPGSGTGYPSAPEYGGPYGAGYGAAYPGGYPAAPAGSTPAGRAASPPASTIVLLVLSAIATMSCLFSLAGIVPLVLAIVAMTRHRGDPAASRRLTMIGWVVFAVVAALLVLVVIVLFAAAVVDMGQPPGEGFPR